MPEPVHDELAHALRDLAARFGDSAFTDRRRLASLLSDRLTGARRDIKVVSAALDEHIFDALARARPEQIALEIERLAAKLESGAGVRPDIALAIVQACAYGLSLGPLPSQAGVPHAPPDHPWMGISGLAAANPSPVRARSSMARTLLSGAAALIGGLGLVAVAYATLRPRPDPAPPTPPAKADPAQPPPLLRNEKPLPRLSARTTADGTYTSIVFQMFSPATGLVYGTVISGDFWRVGSLEFRSWPVDKLWVAKSTTAAYTYREEKSAHTLLTKWLDNTTKLPDYCITFWHQPNSVRIGGSQMCVAEFADGACHTVGCGDIE